MLGMALNGIFSFVRDFLEYVFSYYNRSSSTHPVSRVLLMRIHYVILGM
jgi:hypothetical protein